MMKCSDEDCKLMRGLIIACTTCEKWGKKDG